MFNEILKYIKVEIIQKTSQNNYPYEKELHVNELKAFISILHKQGVHRLHNMWKKEMESSQFGSLRYCAAMSGKKICRLNRRNAVSNIFTHIHNYILHCVY